MRRFLFANEQIYHVYNRGIDKRPIFITKSEYARALITVNFYRYASPPLRLSKALVLEKSLRESYFRSLAKLDRVVDILAYCLMPNHFHFLLKQRESRGIPTFVANFTNSYTKYFNTKHERTGPLLQGIFKAVRIEDDNQLVHVSRYIHLNPVVSFLIRDEELVSYPWSSFPEYLGTVSENISQTKTVLDHFPSRKTYKTFVYDQVEYGKKLEMIKHLTFE